MSGGDTDNVISLDRQRPPAVAGSSGPQPEPVGSSLTASGAASARGSSLVVLASGRRVTVNHGRDFAGLIRAGQRQG